MKKNFFAILNLDIFKMSRSHITEIVSSKTCIFTIVPIHVGNFFFVDFFPYITFLKIFMKKQFRRFLLSKYRIKMDNKNAKKYYCERCDYFSRNKYDYNRHILTRKHLMDNRNK